MGTQIGQNLGADAEVMEGAAYWLLLPHNLTCFLIEPTYQHWDGLPHISHTLRKCPAGLPVLDLTEAFSQLRLALLPVTLTCVQ